jgi:hypothetical protein
MSFRAAVDKRSGNGISFTSRQHIARDAAEHPPAQSRVAVTFHDRETGGKIKRPRLPLECDNAKRL